MSVQSVSSPPFVPLTYPQNNLSSAQEPADLTDTKWLSRTTSNKAKGSKSGVALFSFVFYSHSVLESGCETATLA